MRLYRIADQWAGTQADAKRISRETGEPWAEVEVPTDKAGLIGFLNADHHDGPKIIINGRPSLEIMAAPPSDDRPAIIAGEISIEEAIASASHPRAIRLAEHIHCRLMELAKREIAN